VVEDVRRDDANDIDAILARSLGLGHVAVIGVAARSNPFGVVASKPSPAKLLAL
jgi:hypothetical protein